MGRFSGRLNNNGQEEEVADNGAMGECSKLILKKNGENPNGSCRKVCSRGHWKPPEDAKLRELVAIYGPQNWNFIAENLEGRSGKSCRLRWYNQLDPKINKRAFTEEEEEKLMEAHRVYGNKWAFISRLFPGRTDNAVKNQWHVLMARKYREKSKSYVKRKYSSDRTVLERRLMEECSNDYIAANDLQLQNGFGQEVFRWNYDNYFSGISLHCLHASCERKSWNMTTEIEESGNHYVHLSRLHYNSPAGSTTQISFAAPISPSESVADRYEDSSHFLQKSAKPMFIDFLGVGAAN
ncbi:Transcription factor, Myb superfamily [Handroanthus impetiginosus]|uniref:Transcription factor, Myb superfamily n=1 Tax=Handroanthus impetiginosus TaxID=429701 RepID=A0A2G9GI20_9LAMI|nr:Transcription factor, Myb superfamily [Handroanthus impetiginosus]